METLVFVGGLHRSGTSLVADALARHPDVAGFEETGVWEDEGQHLQDVLPPARALGGPGRFATHPLAHRTEAHVGDRDAVRRALLRTWQPLWGTAAHCVEKSPPNLLRSRYLASVFPEARFVFMVRHPLAVALSTRTMNRSLRRVPLSTLVAHWCTAYEVARADASRLDRPPVWMRLDELVADPVGGLRRLGEALGVPVVSALAGVRPDPDKAARDWLARPWARLLPSPDRAALSDLESRVDALGYRLYEPPQAPARAASR